MKDALTLRLFKLVESCAAVSSCFFLLKSDSKALFSLLNR